MTRARGLSPGVINELIAQAGFRKYFHFRVRKLIADRSIIGQSMPTAGG
jgi:hypothetical protein